MWHKRGWWSGRRKNRKKSGSYSLFSAGLKTWNIRCWFSQANIHMVTRATFLIDKETNLSCTFKQSRCLCSFCMVWFPINQYAWLFLSFSSWIKWHNSDLNNIESAWKLWCWFWLHMWQYRILKCQLWLMIELARTARTAPKGKNELATDDHVNWMEAPGSNYCSRI